MIDRTDLEKAPTEVNPRLGWALDQVWAWQDLQLASRQACPELLSAEKTIRENPLEIAGLLADEVARLRADIQALRGSGIARVRQLESEVVAFVETLEPVLQEHIEKIDCEAYLSGSTRGADSGCKWFQMEAVHVIGQRISQHQGEDGGAAFDREIAECRAIIGLIESVER